MEWDGKFYFGWPYPPWTGIVYEVDPKAVRSRAVVVLPNETRLRLVKSKEGDVEVKETSTRRDDVKFFKAELMFDTNDDPPTFAGDWKSLTRLINAAAAVNALFSVKLSEDEYQRLSANDNTEFEALKKKLSPRANSLLRLVDFDGEKRVDLYRTGRCP